MNILFQTAEKMVQLAYESGVNYFDTSEMFANGKYELDFHGNHNKLSSHIILFQG